jgi:Flp pilus assembly protein CpaB
MDTDDFNVNLIISTAIVGVMFMMFAHTSAQQEQALAAQSYVGQTVTKKITANSDLRWINTISESPFTPWISVDIVNDGPDSVFIGINNPDQMTEIFGGESIQGMFAGYNRRIEYIFYKTHPTKTASLRIIGKY